MIEQRDLEDVEGQRRGDDERVDRVAIEGDFSESRQRSGSIVLAE